MNEKTILSALLLNNEEEMIQALDSLPQGTMLQIDSTIQEDILHRLSHSQCEEAIWSKLLPLIEPKRISDMVLSHLIRHKMLLLDLCHMELSDRWLKELSIFDEMPVYTLAKRYYLTESYTDGDFIDFYHRFLHAQIDIILFLLDNYLDSCKRSLLIYLCQRFHPVNEAIAKRILAERVRNSLDHSEIKAYYEEYKADGVILLAIAGNLYTDIDILQMLSQIKSVSFANSIRQKSKETILLKKIIDKHY